jgi:isopentenyl phosphate kinase
MKPLYILKIGGSVATHKDKPGISIRKELLRKIALSIKKAKKKKEFSLILIHGAGAAGHQLAKKYDLRNGVSGNEKKFYGSMLSSISNQKLNNAIFEIFVLAGLKIVPVHTASTIIQKDKKISNCNLKIIKKALEKDCIPLLYGEMVFDEKMDMSICSGDAIAPYLAKKIGAEKVFFSSDIDGVFDKDPHLYKDAKLIENININEIKNNEKFKLTNSHNIDVTGGLSGKIKKLDLKHNENLKSIEIFNGFNQKNYEKIILEKKFPHTILNLKIKG